MSNNWAGNTQKGRQGFQKTQPKAASPTSNGTGGFLSRLFGSKKLASAPDAGVEVPETYLSELEQKYAKVREGLGDNIKCYACGRKNLSKLMKQPDGRIICQVCSRGGEGDNFIQAGPWLAPSRAEIREAKKADKAK